MENDLVRRLFIFCSEISLKCFFSKNNNNNRQDRTYLSVAKWIKALSFCRTPTWCSTSCSSDSSSSVSWVKDVFWPGGEGTHFYFQQMCAECGALRLRLASYEWVCGSAGGCMGAISACIHSLQINILDVHYLQIWKGASLLLSWSQDSVSG